MYNNIFVELKYKRLKIFMHNVINNNLQFGSFDTTASLIIADNYNKIIHWSIPKCLLSTFYYNTYAIALRFSAVGFLDLEQTIGRNNAFHRFAVFADAASTSRNSAEISIGNESE